MALDKVIENIRNEGQRAADARLKEARKEADAIREDAEKRAAELKEKREKELSGAVEALKLRDVAAAELEAKKMRLNAEKEVLKAARDSVLDRLKNLPAEERVAHIQALVGRAAVDNGRVYVAEQDQAAAKEAGVNVAGTMPILGGVVVVSQDDATREDLTYETLIDEVWTGSLNEVALTLFGKTE